LKKTNILLLCALTLSLNGCVFYASKALCGLGSWEDYFDDVSSAAIKGDVLVIEGDIRRRSACSIYAGDPIKRCGSFVISADKRSPQVALDPSSVLENPVIRNMAATESGDAKIIYHGIFPYSERYFATCPTDSAKKGQTGLDVITTYPDYVLRATQQVRYLLKKNENDRIVISDPRGRRLRQLSQFIVYGNNRIYYVSRSADPAELHVFELKSPAGEKTRPAAIPLVMVGLPVTAVFDILTSPIQLLYYWNEHGIM
jgi:hypothetical protein